MSLVQSIRRELAENTHPGEYDFRIKGPRNIAVPTIINNVPDAVGLRCLEVLPSRINKPNIEVTCIQYEGAQVIITGKILMEYRGTPGLEVHGLVFSVWSPKDAKFRHYDMEWGVL